MTDEMKKADEFVNNVVKLVQNNYTQLEIAKERMNDGITISKASNSIIARINVRPNKYNTHIDVNTIRERVEEIGSIASGHRADYITSTRKARKKDKQSRPPNAGPIKVLNVGKSRKDDAPVFEIEYKYLNPNHRN
jgi:hypothetical protein